MESDDEISNELQRCIGRWKQHKRDVADINVLKRNADRRLLDHMEDTLQVHFGDKEEGKQWKEELAFLRNCGNAGVVDDFADRFFWQVLKIRHPPMIRKAPLTLPGQPPSHDKTSKGAAK